MNTNLYKELSNAIVRLHCFIALNAAKDFILKEDQRVGDIQAELIRSGGPVDTTVLSEFIEAELTARIEREMLTQEMLPTVLKNLQKKYSITFTDDFQGLLKLKGLQPI